MVKKYKKQQYFELAWLYIRNSIGNCGCYRKLVIISLTNYLDRRKKKVNFQKDNVGMYEHYKINLIQ